jgi:hypothetical protein
MRLKNTFLAMFKGQMHLHGSIRLPVWRSADFERFLQERENIKPALHYGDDGPWVAKLRKLRQIKSNGYFFLGDRDVADGFQIRQ